MSSAFMAELFYYRGKMANMKKVELAGCVILDDYNRMLLLHRSTEELTHWELPGGKLEENETAETAALREIKEELGVDVRLVKSLGAGGFEIKDNEYHYTWFQAVIESGIPDLREPDMFDDLEYFDVEDLPSLALSQNMQVLFNKIFSGEVSL